MSDYISKSALLEELDCYEKELYKDKREAIDTEDEMVLFAILNQETVISRITKSVMYSIPTVDEKEIIRKTVERIVERLEGELKWTMAEQTIECERHNGYGSPLQSKNSGKIEALKKSIEIVKEEGGIE